MHIKSISLNNLRGFKDSGLIEFSKGINLLVGHNNAGKSTILKAIQLLQQNSHGNGLSMKDIRLNQDDALISIKIDRLIPKYINIPNIKDSIPIKPEDMNNGIIINKIHKGVPGFTSGLYSQNNSKIIPLLPFSNKYPDNFIYTFLARRKIQSYSQSSISEDSIRTVNQDFSNLPAKINDIMNSYGLPKYNEYVDACKSILGTDPVVTFPTPGQSGHHGNIVPGMRIDSDKQIPIDDMGEGIPNILGLVVDLCNTKGDKLFLIEELENDLHPAALKKLLEIIIKKSDKNQFIISTHSNIVTKYLGSLPETKIFHITMEHLERIPTSTITETNNTSEARMELLEGLGYELFDFDLHKGYLISEESSAEQIIKEFLIPEFVPDLRWKLKTIAANGVDDVEPRINDFLRLFVYLHTAPMYKNKAWVLVDGDEAGHNILNKVKEKFNKNNGWDDKQFRSLSKDNFERYYPQQFQEEVGRILDLDHTNKREEKKELLKKVITYIQTNKDEAKTEFEKSAKEVIDVLKEINTQLQ